MDTSTTNANYYITKLNMQPHPEKGYFAESFRNSNKDFSYSNCHYLLNEKTVTLFRKIKSDESIGIIDGKNIEIITINPDSGVTKILKLGKDIDNGEELSVIIPANYWASFSCRKEAKKADFCITLLTVVPEFKLDELVIKEYTLLKEEIPKLNFSEIEKFVSDLE